MATDAFISIHAQDGLTRVNSHRILYYRAMKDGQTHIQLNVNGVALVARESAEEIDEMVMIARKMEAAAKKDKK
jgi:hypothetical protein